MTRMNSLYEIAMGALIFISIDRLCKFISASIVNSKKDLRVTMLKIELMTLFATLFIAVQFV